MTARPPLRRRVPPGLAAVLALFLAAPALASAQDAPRTQSCRLEGTWHETRAGWTTRIDGAARWSTWNGGPPVDERTTPAGAGWLEVTPALLVFDYDGNDGGYGYEWYFEQDCSVLVLHLVTRSGQGAGALEYRLTRARP